MDCCRGRAQRPCVCIIPLGGSCLTLTELPELTQDLEIDLEGTNRTLCTRTQEKGAVTLQGTDPDLPMSVQKSPVEAWVSGGLLQGWEHSVYQYMHKIF